MINKEVRVDTELHRNVLEACKARRDLSLKVMRKKYPQWKRAEELHTGYIKETESDRLKKIGRTNGVNDYTTIDVSMSYATAMSMHTYWTSVFLGRNPIMQFAARHGEPEMAVQAMDALHDYQVYAGRQLVPYYVWLLDVGKYGTGFLWNYWDEEFSVVSRFEDIPQTYLGLPIPGKTRRARITEKKRKYQGNKVFNVRPYNMRVDPRVDLQNYQKGEFIGRKVEFTWSDLLEGQENGKYFNIDVVEKRRLSKMREVDEQTGNQHYPEGGNDYSRSLSMNDLGTFKGEEFVIKIQPDRWKLGKTRYPEKWVFTWVEDEILIGCRPLGCYHDRFPCSILEYEMDHGLLFKRGVHEVLEPMNDTMNWLVNTHFFNIRRVLNDNLIVDPSRVVMKDLMNNKPGKMIRLKESAYGEDVRSAVHQLQVGDVTQQHLMDTRLVNELAHKMVGVNENIMGTIHPGGRKTATEIRTSSTFGINRLKTNSEFFSAGGWTENVMMMLSNTQQYYDDEQIFKVSGELGGELTNMMITPDDIVGHFDFVAVDGTLPIDRMAQANLWKELFQILASVEGLGAGFDLSKIFSYTAQLAGAKNVNQFKINVVPDNELMNEAQKGNVTRIGTSGAGGVSDGAAQLESLLAAGEQ